MTSRLESIVYHKNKKLNVSKVVHERYIRSDISCGIKGCTECPNEHMLKNNIPLLKHDAPCIVIPDVSLDQRERSRTMASLRKIAADHLRFSIVFANTVFNATSIQRRHGWLPAKFDIRAVSRVAQWYRSHVGKQWPGLKVIVVTTRERYDLWEEVLGSEADGGVLVFDEFLKTYHPDVLPQYNSIESSSEHKRLDITLKSPTEHARSRIKDKSQGEYQKHLSDYEIEQGLSTGKLIQGVLKGIQNTSAGEKQAIISRGHLGKPDILIVGSVRRNRAIDGDTVVVRLLDQQGDVDSTDLPTQPEEKKADDVDGFDFDIGEAVEYTDGKGVEKLGAVYGEVVGITNRTWRPFVATIKPEEGGKMSSTTGPTDSRHPRGHFIRSLGPIGDLDTEINAILVEHDIAVSQSSLAFSEKCLREIPDYSPENPWLPDQDEINLRRDLRGKNIFSIDPKGSKDIDDALSMVDLGDGNYELGVHIADPAYFLPIGSFTDLEARRRGTTIYLSDRRFNMIPPALSEHNCSLRGGVDRYAVSVIWKLDSNFEVLDTWFGRTVIRSTLEMYYEQAQMLLDMKSGIPDLPENLEEKLRTPILLLARAMRKIRERRKNMGALELESTEVKFMVDSETQEINDILPKKGLEIHKIVEEAMIMANSFVARRIWDAYPDVAVLRHHPLPTPERFRRLINMAATKGFRLDCSSNRKLAQSLAAVTEKLIQTDPDFVFLLKAMATLAMSEAEYISSGDYPQDQYKHYGLALEFYTHFTESTELFQGLYISQKVKNGHAMIEQAVISEIRSNGFMVYIPRFGLRSPVYLRDKHGRSIVPMSVITGNSNDTGHLTNPAIESTETETTVTLPSIGSSKPQSVKFRVFDHLLVRLKTLESRYHWNHIYTEIVTLSVKNTSSNQDQKQLEPSDLVAEIRDMSVKDEKRPFVAEPIPKSKKEFYSIVEKFRSIAVSEIHSDRI
ncbi:hypothetical protein H4219_001128 [Mycoemilia scoparia]|uniref:DIS3-like exonuclease 1 n=1 Tax=Mycoemilia scoparia TaxID=417184 RepID=A0A9W8A7F8_9FUNG|nr:hypothetical protein H4219_001128 [Mycoemilia scoparia]